MPPGRRRPLLHCASRAAPAAIRRVSVAADGTEGNGHSCGPTISEDGRYVALFSGASNLVTGDSIDAWDIFVQDRHTGVVNRVSVASDGTGGNGGSLKPALSADGRLIAFESEASNLVPGDFNLASDVFAVDNLAGSGAAVYLPAIVRRAPQTSQRHGN